MSKNRVWNQAVGLRGMIEQMLAVEHEFEFETTLELAGVDRPVIAQCVEVEGTVHVTSVVMGREERKDWNPDGSYNPRVVRHAADITALLDDDQMALIAGDAEEWLKEQDYENMAAAA